MRIQFAFQGGGARLVTLLPAVQAIQDLISNRSIEVQKCAGTSAGSIAAILLAGNANIPAIYQYLQRVSNEVEQAFPIPKLTKAWPILFGSGIADEKKLQTVIRGALTAGGIPPETEIQQLQRQCITVSTDLYNKRTLIADGNCSVIKAIMDSSAVPFYLRIGGVVDGGILDNLPASFLANDTVSAQNFGPVIAVSFKENSYAAPSNRPLHFLLNLFDAVITHKTRSTIGTLGEENVLLLDGSVSSFDVKTFIDPGLNQFYFEKVRTESRDWLKQWIDKQNLQRFHARKTVPKDIGDFISDVAKHQRNNNNITLTHSVFEVTTPKLGTGQPSYDTIRVIDSIQTGNDPVYVYSVKLFSGDFGLVGEPQFEVVNPDGSLREVRAIGIPDNAGLYDWTHIFFTPPLPPNSGPYELTQTQTAIDVMAPLDKTGADYLTVLLSQALEARELEIRLVVPLDYPELFMLNGDETAMRKTSENEASITAGQDKLVAGVASRMNASKCPANMRGYCWSRDGLRLNEMLQVVYIKSGLGVEP